MEPTRCVVLVAVLSILSIAGCSMPKAADLKPSNLFSLNNTWPWGKDDDELKPEIPGRVVGMWTDTVLHKPGETPQRGFGGRLIFYGRDANTPVAVDGELVVYAFDETGREPTDNKPTRRYVFPADQVALHYSKTPVGASYSFWLPWDEAGGPQTEVSLICRFEPKGGAVITSEQTPHRLPGALTAAAVLAATKNGPKLPEGVASRPAMAQLPSHSVGLAGLTGAQLANFETPVPNLAMPAHAPAPMVATVPTRQMTTTSIALPNNFQLPRGATAVRPAVIPARNLPPAQTNGTPSLPQPLPAVDAPQMTPGRSTTAYQPQSRAILPAAYNPTYASGSLPGRAVNHQLQARLSNGIAPAQTMHAVAQQHGAGATAPNQPGMLPPQPQALPIHTAGAANVSYR